MSAATILNMGKCVVSPDSRMSASSDEISEPFGQEESTVDLDEWEAARLRSAMCLEPEDQVPVGEYAPVDESEPAEDEVPFAGHDQTVQCDEWQLEQLRCEASGYYDDVPTVHYPSHDPTPPAPEPAGPREQTAPVAAGVARATERTAPVPEETRGTSLPRPLRWLFAAFRRMRRPRRLASEPVAAIAAPAARRTQLPSSPAR